MKGVLTSRQMKAIDQRAITELGIPSLVLMENAARGFAESILSFYPCAARGKVLILCGTGNNAGDGAVIARWLQIMGALPHVLLIDETKATPELKQNLDWCARLEIPIHPFPGSESQWFRLSHGASLIIDAIYGIGFKGMPSEGFVNIVRLVNSSGIPVCSVDIPSGLDADSGSADHCIKADLTIAMQAYKPGHFLGKGKSACGKLACVSIGIPESFYQKELQIQLCQGSDFHVSHRRPDAHKGDYGRLILIGAAKEYSGATFLAAKAALRAGAGYLYIWQEPELADIYCGHIPEVLIRSFVRSGQELDIVTLKEMWADSSAILIGPGLGTDARALQKLELVLDMKDIPAVLDADALNLIAIHPRLLDKLNRENLILTPHWGEFCRLAGISKEELASSPIEHLNAFLPQSPVTILLKSHTSLLRKNESIRIINAGNDGLATGGSGDVLAGITASFLAQGLCAHDAALQAALLLGKTAEYLGKKRNPASIIPSDIINHLMLESH